MSKFDQINAVELTTENVVLRSHELPELVHLDDPALAVMEDLSQHAPNFFSDSLLIDDAIRQVRLHAMHFLLVLSEDEKLTGLLCSEDLVGAKAIKIIRDRGISREKLTAKMLMRPVSQVPAFRMQSIRYAKVGNVVETLKKLNQHYAFVIEDEKIDDADCICGVFSTWKISQQLHVEIADSINQAETLSELQKRKQK